MTMLSNIHQLWPAEWLFLKRFWWSRALDLYPGLCLTESSPHLCSIISMVLWIHWDVQSRVHCEGWQLMMGATRTSWSHMSSGIKDALWLTTIPGAVMMFLRTSRSHYNFHNIEDMMADKILSVQPCKSHALNRDTVWIQSPSILTGPSVAELRQFGSPASSRWTFCAFCRIDLNMIKCSIMLRVSAIIINCVGDWRKCGTL